MNYVWEAVLQAKKENKNQDELCFVEADNPSPYMELSVTDLNANALDGEWIEVNPLYRLGGVFGELFDRNISGMRQAREIFFDVCIHYIAQMDLREGLSREDYYYEMIRNDIDNGAYGEDIRNNFRLFGKEEQEIILRFYLYLLKTGNYMEIFKQIVVRLYPNAYVYENNETNNELFVYLGVRENEEEKKRAVLLQNMFLPLKETSYFFFEHHFGIMGVDETMMMDEILLF